MASEKRGLQGIKTTGALLDTRRARTPAGALLELSAMANEKNLLNKELARWKRRHAEIQARLDQIRAKEQKLLALVQGSDVTTLDVGRVASGSGDGRPTPQAKPTSASAPAPAAGRSFKVTELNY